MPKGGEPVDWHTIKMEYITTDTSYRRLAKKYGMDVASIGRRAKAEDWVGQRQRFVDRTETETLNSVCQERKERTARLLRASDMLLDRVQELLENADDPVTDTSVMRDIAVVLKSLKEIQMVRSEEDILEQEARIAKLRKEAAEEDDKKPPVLEILGLPEEYTV
jgi:hypothetical protein